MVHTCNLNYMEHGHRRVTCKVFFGGEGSKVNSEPDEVT